jgi:hypothetical protein
VQTVAAREIPALDTLHRRYQAQGLRIAGVSIDVDDDRAKVAEFAASLGASYAIWYDPRRQGEHHLPRARRAGELSDRPATGRCVGGTWGPGDGRTTAP